MDSDTLIIRGARQHNLKNVNLEIPKGKLVVITGPSGSGKSSLAFDTLYAEGQRRFVESLSAYARQFLERIDKPDVDVIEGLSPAIAIEQKGTSRNPRSTVGTITEIYDYLRLMFAKVGQVFCCRCGREIRSQTPQYMVDRLLGLPQGSHLVIMAPLVKDEVSDARKLFDQRRRDGFVRVRVDGDIFDLSDDIPIDPCVPHRIDLVVDRLIMREEVRERLAEAVELALRCGGGAMRVLTETGEELTFSEHHACWECGVTYPEVSPRFFSFNSPHGACPRCEGLGVVEAALGLGRRGTTRSDDVVVPTVSQCPVCSGRRLREEARFIRLQNRSISEVCAMPVKEVVDFFKGFVVRSGDTAIAQPILAEVVRRLRFLVDVGLDYLSLDRAASSLSGGEGERIRLATQVGSGLSGVLYILDEPSVGLHLRDHIRLLETLRRLQDMGNTVIVVEHDPTTIFSADYVVDMGPGSGVQGGEVMYAGTPDGLKERKGSVTGAYLSGRMKIMPPTVRRLPQQGWIVMTGAHAHNLKGVEAKIPLGLFTCVTGVSGSGKSTLVVDVLSRALQRRLRGIEIPVEDLDALGGVEMVNNVVEINQRPISRSSRSNAATYTGVFDLARDLFARVPEARIRGYTKGRFSFNIKGGRCEACQGEGTIRVEMHFLPDAHVTCEECEGRRFNRATLEVRYKGRNLAEVLDMTVDESLMFFRNVPSLKRRLQLLSDVGLGYLILGQPAPTLSGGEAQRIKLARELGGRSTGRTVYILDEPTTGLHFAEIEQLLTVLNRLVDEGNTVVVIEHNLDVIKCADHIVDLGPEGGDEGGEIVVAGTPEDVASCAESYTGRFLRQALRGVTPRA